MATVYFATNRKKDGTGRFGFGAQIVPPDPAAMTYAVMEVTNIALPDESSGNLSNPTDVSTGDFSATAKQAIISAGKSLLIFIHGFDNSFEDAIQRAGFNHDWFAQGGVDTTVIAFTWPSAGVLIDSPPHGLTDAYKTDQAQAGKSGFHLASFLANVDALQRAFRSANPNAKVFLLAHSMGNWALQAGVQAWSEHRAGADIMFDHVFLPAADEVAGSFERPAGARLSNLRNLANQISIYSNRGDVVIWVSAAVNLDSRLGFDGPGDKSNTAIYPPAKYRLVDCTEVSDYDRCNPFDASHQYYRRSRRVHDDICAAMKAGSLPGGVIAF